jgi:hypothetical protein
MRTLIADVILPPEPDQAKVRIGIRWHTGATDELTVAGPPTPVKKIIDKPYAGKPHVRTERGLGKRAIPVPRP